MVVRFKRPSDATPTQTADTTLQRQLEEVGVGVKQNKMGVIDNWKLNRRASQMQLDEQTEKMSAQKVESIATFLHSLKLQGTALRTAISRVYGDLIVAEMQAMGECHSAAVQAQKSAQMVASLANLLSKNEDIDQVERFYAAGKISADDAAAMIAQIVDWHVAAEERLAKMCQAVADTTDSVYQSGFAPVNHRFGKH
ncbi:MAG: hypothetical protein LWW81_10600 [Rhodocyclales bacterium]|nr:hypothetical protein [Rhodocyclales bacterium]